ncbi:hypothetical protein QP547_02580 [Weeksella virosa]|uniref:hypothetical protein n=1 Tax=Weeksella virosa TaxID=1014 RepID=UPI002556BB8C|nr:hypothetical protein [Weeksella virosa]MDK7674693.1 hypothetical protein [Weeksella virosa]
MKKNILLALFFAGLQVQAQHNVSDYKYVIVLEKFTDFKENQYKLNQYLKILLRNKSYTLVSDVVESWNAELKADPCLAATADVKKVRNFLSNELEVYFYNCTENELAKFDGKSRIKDYEKGYRDALKSAINKMPPQNGKTASAKNVVVTKNKPMPILEKNKKVEKQNQPQKQKTTKETPKKYHQLYYSDGKKYYLETIATNNYLLIEETTSNIVARFSPSTKDGIYKVTVINGKEEYQTIGYMNENELSIEYLIDNQTKLIKFVQP